MNLRLLALTATLLAAGAGCIVVYDDPPPRRRAVYRERVDSPPASPVESAAPTEESSEVVEVHDVVYREYYGCTDEEIVLLPHYRRYYSLSDDDIYFIYFVARRSNVSFDVCFHSYYYDCGRNYDRLVVAYNVPREHFFVSVGVGVTTYPPVYQRTYACYRSGTYVSFSNTEYVALVHMRVACDYQGHPPATYFARVQATGSTSRVIVESRDQCGRGGRTAVGAQVTVKATRAWNLPPQQKQQWHEQHRESAVKAEGTFRDHHTEQVQKVQAREKAAPAKTPAQDGAQRGTPGNNGPGAARAKPGNPPTDHGPDGRPVEKRPPENHAPPENRKKERDK
jgi:hypothetical protein